MAHMANAIATLLLFLAICAGFAQAHEVEGCSFPANISSHANLTVAGAALEALGGADLFASHSTVFLPTDTAFAGLLTALNVTSPSQLLTDFMNQTVAVLAYHEIPDHFYTQAQLVGNRTLQTELGVLASEAAGRSVSYNLTFQRSANGQVRVRGTNTTGTLLDAGEDICNRYVYTIDTVLVPEDNLADVPTNVTAVLAASSGLETEAPVPAAAADSDGDDASAPAPAAADSDGDDAPSPDQGAPVTTAAPLLAVAAVGASLLLAAL